MSNTIKLHSVLVAEGSASGGNPEDFAQITVLYGDNSGNYCIIGTCYGNNTGSCCVISFTG